MNERDKMIIRKWSSLVSDGLVTDPLEIACEIAQELVHRGTDITIDEVEVRLDELREMGQLG